MKNDALLISILTISTCISNFASATVSQLASDNAVEARKCIQVNDDKERLACFDKAFANMSAGVAESNSLPPEKSAVDAFGARHLDEKNEEKVEEIRLTVEKVELNARKRQVFYFTNGQVWENKKSAKLRIKPGDIAVVSEGAFSAYYLAKENIRGRVRVKRIK